MLAHGFHPAGVSVAYLDTVMNPELPSCCFCVSVPFLKLYPVDMVELPVLVVVDADTLEVLRLALVDVS